jgi:hypothetical protein
MLVFEEWGYSLTWLQHVLQVQEVQLNTELDREGIKAAVQRVTGRVP